MLQQGIQPHVYYYNADGCSRMLRMQERMLQQGIQPNVYYYNALVACFRTEAQDESDWRKREMLVQNAYRVLEVQLPKLNLSPATN